MILEGVSILDNMAVAAAGRRKSVVARGQVVWHCCTSLYRIYRAMTLWNSKGGKKQILIPSKIAVIYIGFQ